MDSQDDLQVSVVASYQSNVKNMVESSNREYESSTLGLGWSMEVSRIVVKNRLVKESFDSSFYLVAEGGIYPLYRLGTEGDAISFYSVEHPYWKFYYFKASKESRWEIHKENGAVWVYGGDDSAIETRIHWDNWVGAASSNGGESFPVGWSLTSVKSFAGNSITYSYEKEEAQIGDCSYTRAIRLIKVVSTFGDTAEFVYKDKEAFECVWPHSSKGGKNPYQFNCENKFIDSIQVKNREGQLLYVQQLRYDFYDIFQKGQLYKKRFLTSATQVCYKDANMISVPSMKFEYETNRRNPNPGALLQVTYPYGQKYQYSYKNDTLPAGSPKVEFTKPGAEYAASVYHALNYTVVLFQNQNTNIVRVYTWNDRPFKDSADTELKYPSINLVREEDSVITSNADHTMLKRPSAVNGKCTLSHNALKEYAAIKILGGSSLVDSFTIDDPKTSKTGNILILYNRTAGEGEDTKYYYPDVSKDSNNMVEVNIPIKGSIKFKSDVTKAQYSTTSQTTNILVEFSDNGSISFNYKPEEIKNFFAWDAPTHTLSFNFPRDWKTKLNTSDLGTNTVLTLRCSFYLDVTYGENINIVGCCINSVSTLGPGEQYYNSTKPSVRVPLITVRWGCFGKDTKITMADGTQKLISDIKAGDQVLSEKKIWAPDKGV